MAKAEASVEELVEMIFFLERGRRPLRVVLMLLIEHQSHRSLPDLW